MRGGLGSSAAATVAGLRIYERLTARPDLDDLLATATRLDHHADNVSAALLGGLTLSCVTDSGTVIARAIRWPWPTIQAVVAMPGVEIATPEARKVLPEAYPLADAVFNLQRALLFVHAIERREYACCGKPCGTAGISLSGRPSSPGLDAALSLEHPQPRGRLSQRIGTRRLWRWPQAAYDEIERLLSGRVQPARCSVSGTNRGRSPVRSQGMSHFTGLRCRMCGESYPAAALYVCSECLGPLEVSYDYDSIREAVNPAEVSTRANNLWRYRELLPDRR